MLRNNKYTAIYESGLLLLMLPSGHKSLST